MTISVIVSPQPRRLTMRRKATFVKPAIGASSSGGSTTIDPRSRGPLTGAGGVGGEWRV
jgi:hypothetical protein